MTLSNIIVEICSVFTLALQFICTLCNVYRMSKENKEEGERKLHPPLFLDTAISRSFIISYALL